jgi:hypothetical protein
MKNLTNMKNAMLPIMALAMGLFLGSCSASSHIEKADDVNFAHYKSFAFVQRDSSIQHGRNDIIDANVKKAITEEMEKKGLRRNDRNPDIIIDYGLNVERGTARESNPVYSSPYMQPFYNPASRRIGYMYMPSQMMGYNEYNRAVKNGTLTINIYDARNDRMIWQGWTQNELNKGNFTSNDVKSDVRSILKKLDNKG